MRFSLSRVILAALAFFLPFAVYLKTSSPTVTFIDSGELALVCYTLGIPHPTGYLLYALLGKLVTMLPFGSVIGRLNFLSAIFVAGAVLFLYLSLRKLLLESYKSRKGILLVEMSALFLSLGFAFTPTLWSQATINEVYSLHIFFVSLLILLILKWDQTRSDKLFFFIIFLYGLSFTNHMTTVLFFPSLLFFLWSGWGRKLLARHRLSTGVLIFVLTFSLYLYLPIRSSTEPLLNWGHPTNWHNFKSHLTGWQYQVWMFAGSPEELWQNLKNYGGLLLEQFPPLVLSLGLLGSWFLLQERVRLAVFLLLLAILTIIHGVNFSIGEIENYFLPSYLSFTFLVAGGAWFLSNLILTRVAKLPKRLVPTVLLLISVLLASLAFFKNYQKQDKSRNYFAYDYTANILRSADPPALILTDIWDYYAPYLYIHFVEGKDQGKIMLDLELLRRSWYYNFVRQAHPEIYRKSEREIKEFVEAVYPFEHQEEFDPNFIEAKYQNLLSSLVQKNLSDRSVHLMLAKAEAFRRNYYQIPQGMTYRVNSDSQYLPYPPPRFELRGLDDPKIFKDGRTRFHLSFYPIRLEERAKYEEVFGFDSLASELNQLARQLRASLNQNQSI